MLLPEAPSRGPLREQQRRGKRRLALALCAAPLVIGGSLVLEAIRDPAMIATRWDIWLIFVALPYAAAAMLAWRARS